MKRSAYVTPVLAVQPRVRASEWFHMVLEEAVNRLPQVLQEFMARQGYRIHPCQLLEGTWGVWGMMSPREKRIWVAETSIRRQGGVRDIAETLYHELGHGVDYGWDEAEKPISQDAAFQRAYLHDVRRLLPQERERLAYYIQGSSWWQATLRGSEETFAEVFAALLLAALGYDAHPPMLRLFPQTARYLRKEVFLKRLGCRIRVRLPKTRVLTQVLHVWVNHWANAGMRALRPSERVLALWFSLLGHVQFALAPGGSGNPFHAVALPGNGSC